MYHWLTKYFPPPLIPQLVAEAHHWYYILEMGFYMSLLLCVSVDVKRKVSVSLQDQDSRIKNLPPTLYLQHFFRSLWDYHSSGQNQRCDLSQPFLFFLHSVIQMLFNTDYVLDHLLLHDDYVYLAFAVILKLRVAGFNIFSRRLAHSLKKTPEKQRRLTTKITRFGFAPSLNCFICWNHSLLPV